jgi:hypothetical protein
MAPYGFGRKTEQNPKEPFIADITDGEDLEEAKTIRQMLNPNEEVFVVATLVKIQI